MRAPQALQELGLGGAERAAAALATSGGDIQLVAPVTKQEARSLRLTKAEADAMVEALGGPLYKQLANSGGSRPLIALLARLNEHIVQSGPSSEYTQGFKYDTSPGG